MPFNTKKNICFAIINTCLSILSAQLPQLPENLIERPAPVIETFIQRIEIPPEFPDGNLACKKYLYAKLRHPKTIAKLIKDNKISIEFRLYMYGRIAILVVKGALKPRIKKDLAKVFSEFPRFKIGCGNCQSHPYWFYLDSNLMAIPNAEKTTVYELTDSGTYWVMNFRDR